MTTTTSTTNTMNQQRKKFNARRVTKIALPSAHVALFSQEEAAALNAVTKYLISEVGVALNHWLWLSKIPSDICAYDYNLSKAMLRISMSKLPFHAQHEKSFGWVRGLAAQLSEFDIPPTLFESTLFCGDLSRNLARCSQQYAARLCRDIGEILYDYVNEMDQELWEIFSLCKSDREAITECLQRYLSYAMQDFERAVQSPAPTLTAYPYEIPAQAGAQDAELDAALDAELGTELDAFESQFVFSSYVPCVKTYCVYDACSECYQNLLAWDEEKATFYALFTEGPCTSVDDFVAMEDLLEGAALFDEDTQTQTPTSRFLRTIEEELYALATPEDFEPITGHTCDKNGDSLHGLFDTDYEDAEPFDDDEDSDEDGEGDDKCDAFDNLFEDEPLLDALATTEEETNERYDSLEHLFDDVDGEF